MRLLCGALTFAVGAMCLSLGTEARAGDDATAPVPITASVTGSVRVTIPIPNSVIYLDGVAIGGQEATRDGVPVGLHRIQVVAPGYEPLIQDVQVTEGQTFTLNIPGLQPAVNQPAGAAPWAVSTDGPPGLQSMPGPPLPHTVPVTFASEDSRPVQLRLTPGRRARASRSQAQSQHPPPQTCVTPCSLAVVPGPVHLSFPGLTFRQELEVPDAAGTHVQLRSGSRGLFIGGLIVTVAGAGIAAAGIFSAGGSYGGGLIAAVVGGVIALVGVPIALVGSRRLSSVRMISPGNGHAGPSPAHLRFVSAGVAPASDGGLLAGAAFSF